MLEIWLGFCGLAVSGSQPRMAVQLKLQKHVNIFRYNSKSLSRQSTKQLKLQNHINIFRDNLKSRCIQAAKQLKLQNHIHIFFDNSKSGSRQATKQLKLQNHVRYFCDNSKSEFDKCSKNGWGFVVQVFQAANQGWLYNSNYKNTSIFSAITQNLEAGSQPNS